MSFVYKKIKKNNANYKRFKDLSNSTTIDRYLID